MARKIHAPDLETRSARLRLPIAKKPIYVRAGSGIGLGYRRNRLAGTWVVRIANGRGGNSIQAFAVADDYDEADGDTVLDYWQAQERARTIARAAGVRQVADVKPPTVVDAVTAYEADVRTRGGDLGNVARLRFHPPAPLGEKRVADLTVRDLRRWRDGLAARLAPATVDRTSTILKAALNLAAEGDGRISSRRAWETGLATIADAEESRNVILGEDAVRSIIVGAYQQSEEFGVFVEVAAVTGARPSQMARIEAQDVQGERPDPRLMMPTSRKGRGKKKVTRRPVPIPLSLARRLLDVAKGKGGEAPLLTKKSGAAWRKSDHSRPFERAVKHAGLDPAEVTIYALRHSSIVRQLLGNVPTRVVAVNHDTSVAMLERTYSRYIGDHADALARVTLLDAAAPVGSNVVSLRSAAAI